MSATNGSQQLTLAQVIPLAWSLARKETHRLDDIEDLVQVGLFAYIKAERQHFKNNTAVEKPLSLARVILQRAMRGYYYQQGEWEGAPLRTQAADRAVPLDNSPAAAQAIPSDVPLLTVGLDGAAGTQFELMEFDDYFNALERKCGATARLIVENLLMPSGDCAGRILLEVWVKQQGQHKLRNKSHKIRRSQPRGVKQYIRITPRMVREALHLSSAEWARNMEAIKEFTRNWIGR